MEKLNEKNATFCGRFGFVKNDEIALSTEIAESGFPTEKTEKTELTGFSVFGIIRRS